MQSYQRSLWRCALISDRVSATPLSGDVVPLARQGLLHGREERLVVEAAGQAWQLAGMVPVHAVARAERVEEMSTTPSIVSDALDTLESKQYMVKLK